MNISIGIIGPADSVNQILAVAEEFSEAQFFPFVYESVYQVEELILNNTKPIDQWFFSGVLNYNYALEKRLVTAKQATHPPLYGSSFFGTLLEAQLDTNTVFKKISIDTLSHSEIEKVLSFYQLQSIEYTNLPFSDYTYIHQLARFHEYAYNSGEADVIITSTNHAYQQLKEKEIPVYRMNPSYSSIQLSIQLLIERAQANRFKKSQIGIIGCLVDFYFKQSDGVYYTYKTKQAELDIKKQLLSLAEKVNGSFMPVGNGLYFIYTSRGEVNQQTEQKIIHLSQEMKKVSEIQVKFSIGYGETASQAEQHVHLGFRQNNDLKDSNFYMIDEDQTITVKKASTSEKDLQFSTMSIGNDWKKRVKKSGISVGVMTKILSLVKHYHRSEFSTQDIANWLKTSDRNARRIVLQLERGNLIKQCGEIQSGSRGRPRKLYQFKDQK